MTIPTTREKIQSIIKEMKNVFFEMDEVIEGLWTSLLAEQNVFLIGPPGTAKSQIAKYISRAIGGKFFFKLFHKQLTVDELFGPINILALKQGKFERVTKNTLLDADIAVLDEIWKGSSVINNTLLVALNEKEFQDPDSGAFSKIPLKIAIGTSNEYPQGEELGAIFDRWNVKYEVFYLQESKNFKKLLNSQDVDPIPSLTISIEDLEIEIKKAISLILPDNIVALLESLRRELEKQGIINSPRRWKKAVRLIKAYAVLHNQKTIEEESIAFLENVLWNQPEQQSIVKSILGKLINPLNQKALETLDSAIEIFKKTESLGDNDPYLLEARQKFASMRKSLNDLCDQAKKISKSTLRIEEAQQKIAGYQKQIVIRLTGESF